MREILFRGKRIDNGEWVYSQTVFSHLDNFYIPAQNLKCTVMRNLDIVGNISEIRCKDGKCFFKVQTETVGQFTGLTDKNGKKIFEGDIIKATDSVPEYNLMVVRNEGFGCFNDYYFGGEKHYTEQIRNADWYLCYKIIGNIHDNPELLGGDI